MKYDHHHIPEFMGATGKCRVCEVTVTLDSHDTPSRPRPLGNEWVVDCPICRNKISCTKPLDNKQEKL